MMNKNITFNLIEHAKKSAQNTALILSDTSIDYQTLNNLVWKVSIVLFNKGIRSGNIVGVLQNHELLRVLCTLGLIRLGATVVPLARSLTTHQRAHILATAGVTHIITDFLPPSNERAVVVPINLGEITSQDVTRHDLLSEAPSSDCLLVPGSGSTGKPKIIPQSHSTIRHRVSLAFSCVVETAQERVLSLTNLEFAAGINRLLSVISRGGAFSVLDRPMSSIAGYCNEKSITTLFCSSFHAESLLRALPQAQPILLPGLNSLRISGSAVSLGLRTSVRDRLNPNLHLVYGANECGRISAAIPPNVFQDQFTVGCPLPGVEVEVVSSSGAGLSCGERGHIRVRTPSVVPGYVNDREASEKSFRDGWFYTGDVGEFCLDGSIRLFGRSDGMMIINGINIYPIEIEQTIKEIPGVRDVVAMPLKDGMHQDVPIAAVSLETHVKLSANEIQQITTMILGFRSPRRIFILNEIPRNSNGKIQGTELNNLLKLQIQKNS